MVSRPMLCSVNSASKMAANTAITVILTRWRRNRFQAALIKSLAISGVREALARHRPDIVVDEKGYADWFHSIRTASLTLR
jgi:hypothetical protein